MTGNTSNRGGLLAHPEIGQRDPPQEAIMTDTESVHVEVDTDACVGSGTCAMIDPDHFRLVDGKAVVIADQPLPLTEELDDALLSCPVEALRSTPAD